MSSTNRSLARNSHISDYYITPVDEITKFLQVQEEIPLQQIHYILDPCAGGDKDNYMSYPLSLQKYYEKREIPCPSILSIDIREDSDAEIKEDYLLYALTQKPDLIITNPPFNLALPIIQKSLLDVKDNGYVVMLLRLNFFGSNTRKPFWEKYMPIACYIHSKRICFTDNGKTDSIEYMHCVWQKGNYPRKTALQIL